MKQQIQQALSLAVKKVTKIDVKPQNIELEHPDNPKFGDYSSNIAMAIFAKIKEQKAKSKNINKKFQSPIALAQEIAKELKQNILISQYLNIITVVAPGFINLKIKDEYLINQLKDVLKEGSEYGKTNFLKDKKIMVEYAHPNTHKLFHIGHLRNITNGEAIVRILEANGALVVRANYQGDVGMHIAKCLWFLCQDRVFTSNLACKNHVKTGSLHDKIELLGKAYTAGNKAYEEDPKAKKEILTINKKIYDQKDPNINKLWRETRQWSLQYFDTIYKRVDSSFDRFYFESEVFEAGKEIVLQGLKKGIFCKSKGAIIFPGSKFGLHDRVFITQEGNPTYEGKDMELGRLQFAEYNPDLIIHNVGPEQLGYFKVVFMALARLFPYTKGKKYHLAYGWVRLKTGKMSSRSGSVIEGEWLLDEAKRYINKSFDAIDEVTAEAIAVGAVKYSFLKVNPLSEISFDFKESISLEGNSGPYLQYTYARCKSVLEKAASHPAFAKASAGRQPPATSSQQPVVSDWKLEAGSWKLNTEEISILRHFYKFSEIVEQAAKEYTPNLIANFLYELAQKYNTFYNKHRILGSREQDLGVREFRLLLTSATAQIIKNGLNLLGINAPRKM